MVKINPISYWSRKKVGSYDKMYFEGKISIDISLTMCFYVTDSSILVLEFHQYAKREQCLDIGKLKQKHMEAHIHILVQKKYRSYTFTQFCGDLRNIFGIQANLYGDSLRSVKKRWYYLEYFTTMSNYFYFQKFK